jgi:hypothetical protein
VNVIQRKQMGCYYLETILPKDFVRWKSEGIISKISNNIIMVKRQF